MSLRDRTSHGLPVIFRTQEILAKLYHLQVPTPAAADDFRACHLTKHPVLRYRPQIRDKRSKRATCKLTHGEGHIPYNRTEDMLAFEFRGNGLEQRTEPGNERTRNTTCSQIIASNFTNVTAITSTDRSGFLAFPTRVPFFVRFSPLLE